MISNFNKTSDFYKFSNQVNIAYENSKDHHAFTNITHHKCVLKTPNGNGVEKFTIAISKRKLKDKPKISNNTGNKIAYSSKSASSLRRLIDDMLRSAESWGGSTQDTAFGAAVEAFQEKMAEGTPLSLKDLHTHMQNLEKALSADLNTSYVPLRPTGNDTSKKIGSRDHSIRQVKQTLSPLQNSLRNASPGANLVATSKSDFTFKIEESTNPKDKEQVRTKNKNLISSLLSMLPNHLDEHGERASIQHQDKYFSKKNMEEDNKITLYREIRKDLAHISDYVEAKAYLPKDELSNVLNKISNLATQREKSIHHFATQKRHQSLIKETLTAVDKKEKYIARMKAIDNLSPESLWHYNDFLNSELYETIFSAEANLKTPFGYALKISANDGPKVGMDLALSFFGNPKVCDLMSKYGLTAEEAFAIHIYSTEGYTEINEGLRGIKLDKGVNKRVPYPPSDVPPIVSRVAELAISGMSKLPRVTVSPLYRGVTPDHFENDLRKAYQTPGAQVTDKGFLSTSYAQPFNLPWVLVITPSPGKESRFVNIAAFSDKEVELEALALPDTQFQIIDIEDMNDNTFKKLAPLQKPEALTSDFGSVKKIIYVRQIDS
jgi:hypothetical protein